MLVVFGPCRSPPIFTRVAPTLRPHLLLSMCERDAAVAESGALVSKMALQLLAFAFILFVKGVDLSNEALRARLGLADRLLGPEQRPRGLR